MTIVGVAEAWDWARAEFGHAELGDVRRTRRLVRVGAGVLARPGGTIGAVFDNPADLHGAYDFVENDAVAPEALMDAMSLATARRACAFDSVWIATDGSSINITDLKRKKQTGSIGAGNRKARGDKVHTALVLDPEGIPLGLCTQAHWQRGKKRVKSAHDKRLTSEKETQRWLDVRDATRQVMRSYAPGVRLHFLHDREADAWPVLLDAAHSEAGEYTTMRAQWDRRLVNEEQTQDAPTRYLRQALAQSEILGTYDLEVVAGPNRTARTAKMEVRACQVTLDLKDKRTDRHHVAPVYAVVTREVSALPKGQQAVEWLLLTTYPVSLLEDARWVIAGYAKRWRIEQFHLAWKSAGTDVESMQLEAADHRARWSLILAAVAVALLRWQLLARDRPSTPATEEFSNDQIEAVRDLQVRVEVPLRGSVTVGQMVRAIAFLGGWTGAKARPPGTKILARGWERVTAYLWGLKQREMKRKAASEADENARC